MLNSPLVGAHGKFFSTQNKPKVMTSNSQKSSPQLRHIPLGSLNPNSSMGYYCPKPKESPLKTRGFSRHTQLDDGSIQLQTSMSKSNLQLNTSYGTTSMFHVKMNDFLNSNVLSAPLKNNSKPTLDTCSSPVLVQKIQKTTFDSSSARLRNVVTPILVKEKILEKWPPVPMSLQSSPNSTKTNSFLFLENKKKYRIKKVPTVNQTGKEYLYNGSSPLEDIRHNVKLQGLKKYRPNPSCKIDLKEMGELFMVKKNGQPLTKEEEIQVRLLKKKVEISKVFSLKNMDDEDKKAYYRNLLLEFHPDKCKHDPEFSVAIFHFLQSNKERFIDL